MSESENTDPKNVNDVDPVVSKAKPIRKKKKYIPAVTPRLKIALLLVFALFALLSANSIYLAAITVLERVTEKPYQDYFYQLMQLLHLVLGLLIIVPFILFAYFHLIATRKRRNKSAVRMGYMLLIICFTLLISGLLLFRVLGIELRHPTTRQIVYFAHVLTPLAAIWLYWLHRLAGPPIKWRVGGTFALVTAVVVGAMVFVKAQDPHDWSTAGKPDSLDYFKPSLVLTRNGGFISKESLMNDEYCLECHQDIYDDFQHSAHRNSSFNNPPYFFIVAKLREEVAKRDGSVKASRWCAGCHDPVPFLSGKFDDPNFDMVKDETSQAGITCTVCHAITNINSHRGNADYTIEEPIHYPFAYSKNPFLKWVNRQLVKAKPSFHKQVMLKDFHKTTEFCSVCHKVHLPEELNDYKFIRGQNHHDSFWLSGVSGFGASSFHYPPKAQSNCNECHMPRKESTDFGAKLNPETGKLEVHDHMFPSANTGITYLKGFEEGTKRHQEFLQNIVRVDIFGIKEEGGIDGKLTAPLRPELPTLSPGKDYLLESIIRTLKLGHHLTQGTVDSNEIWMDVRLVKDAEFDESGEIIGGEVIGRSGGMDEKRMVDPWSHFVNVFMLDKDGNRIDRRNAEDIFVPLYNHQIPPGAAQVVHYLLQVPEEMKSGKLTVDIKLKYRKFDQTYMNYVAEFHKEQGLPLRDLDPDAEQYVNKLPITTMAHDRITFEVSETGEATANVSESANAKNATFENKTKTWDRWNDYGIGLYLEGRTGGAKGELKQAEQAFQEVESFDLYHGPINLARVYFDEGRLDEAVEAIRRAEKYSDVPGYPGWTVAWLTGRINFQQGNIDESIDNFKSVVDYSSDDSIKRNFDFSRDYRVQNLLGGAYFERSKRERTVSKLPARVEYLEEARNRYLITLTMDVENVAAHYNLSQIYAQLNEAVIQADEEGVDISSVVDKHGFLKAFRVIKEESGSAKDLKEIAEKYLQQSKMHRELHEKYKPDDNARDNAVRKAREQFPWANKAAEALVIYELNRDGAFELKKKSN